MLSEAPSIDLGEIDRLREFGSEELARQFSLAQPNLLKMIQFRLPPGLKTRVDASDILQDAYVEADRRLLEYLAMPKVNPLIWLRQVARQVLSQHYRFHVETAKRSVRAETRMDMLPGIDSMAGELAESMLSPLSTIAQAEIQSQVQQLLQTMDPQDREVLCLKQLEKLSFAEVAKELQIDISTAKRRFQRAAIHLRSIAAQLHCHSNA